MQNHFCTAVSITDLLACQECAINQICCNQCFHIKHKGENGVHPSAKLVDSDVYKNFLKLIHVEWLVGQKLLKALGGFQVSEVNKTYMANAAFYGSQFYREFFKDQMSAQQYLILKCYYSGEAKSFESLSSLEKLLNQAKSLDIIAKHISKLTQPSQQQKQMNGNLDYYTGADVFYLSQFIAYEQNIFYQYIKEKSEKKQQFSIYKYIEEREKSGKEKNETYYSNQFTAFLVEYYRKDSGDKTLFTLNDYVLNYWEFFNTAVQINSTLRQFLDSEVYFYKQYQQIMEKSNFNITYLGFRIWKLNNGVSKELPYLKNHYFLFAFVEGYIKMLIERTYTFMSTEEKQELAKETWMDYIKYIKDYGTLLQDKNKNLKQQEQTQFSFDTYKTYYFYRKRLQQFHQKIKRSTDNIYEKQVAVKFFNYYFGNPIQLKPKLYKDFYEKHQQEKKKKEEQLLQIIDHLKEELKQQEKDQFYEFVFINFIAYSREHGLSIKKQTYQTFKQKVFETMDETYLKLTEQKFRRGDFNAVIEQVEEKLQTKAEELKVVIGETGAKITMGIDKFEEEVLDENLQEEQESEGQEFECPCCKGDIYECQNTECDLMGYCTLCSDM